MRRDANRQVGHYSDAHDPIGPRAIRPLNARRVGIGLLLAAWVLTAAGCGGDDDAQPTGPLNVLMITLDTTRADHLACYGYPHIKTPNLDGLAREGVRLSQCIASAPITLPSHCTIMTGTEPYVHGIRTNAMMPLSQSNLTLAEVLRDRGYRTGAEIAAVVLDRDRGLNQGFESYGDRIISGTGTQPEDNDLFLAVADRFAERRGDDVRKAAVQWLQAHGEGPAPFFLWVHFFDPHEEYDPPEPYHTACRHPYDGEIAFTDEQVGHLLATLDELGVADRTLVVLVADHGEGLGDHGEETHLHFLYDTTLHVPLILRCPSRLPAGEVVDAQVRTIDIVPTVLDLLVQPPKADAQGRSLMALVRGETSDLGLTAYGETFGPYISLGRSHARCLRTGGWKYIHVPRPELYHVADDPGELINLAEQEPDRLLDMRDELYALLAEAPPALTSTQPAPGTSEDTALELAALGYVSASPEAIDELAGQDELALFEPRGPDMKDGLIELELMARALGDMHERNYAQAERLFGELIEHGVDTSVTRGWYARALCLQGKREDAMAYLARAIEKDPGYWQGYVDWGQMLLDAGRSDEAIERFRQALRIKPDIDVAHYNLANALTDVGRLDEAIQVYRRRLEVAPDYAPAHRNLGIILLRQGRQAEALASLRQAIHLDPSFTEARGSLADLLLRQGDIAGAAEQLRAQVRLDPDALKPTFRLVQLLATCDDPAIRNGAEAVTLAEAAAARTGHCSPTVLDLLAAAYAETGQFDRARETAARALELTRAAGDEHAAQGLQARLELYRQNKPFHQPVSTAPASAPSNPEDHENTKE